MAGQFDAQTREQLNHHLDALVQLVQTQCADIDGVRPPDPRLADKFKDLLDLSLAVRGRPLFYEYIGTGRGRGPYVELCDGSVKLDFINGIGVHIFGHSHPLVLKAAARGGLADILMQGHLQMNMEYFDFAKTVIDMAKGSRLVHGWTCPSGSMANENALKMVRQKNSPARMVLALTDSFAGRTTMMAEITDNPKYKEGLPEYHEVLRVPYFDKKRPAESIETALRVLREHIAKHPKNISSFYFEPMLGEGGYRVAPREYFIPLLEECRKHGIANWADEVQTFLRTGQPFAFQTLGLGEYVDVVAIAKTAQCGMTLFTEEYNPRPGLVAGTFASSTPALAAGQAILEEMRDHNYFGADGRIAKIHKEFMSRLNDLCQGSLKGLLEDPEGLGLMIAVTPLSGDKDKVMKLLKVMYNRGFIAFGCGKDPMRLRFLVPATVESRDLQVACEILEASILEVARG